MTIEHARKNIIIRNAAGQRRVQLERNDHGGRGFVFRVDFGRGAGYIGGRTLYLAWNSGSRQWARRSAGLPWYAPILQAALTRNANAVPYAARF